jgi:hypothetical protein
MVFFSISTIDSFVFVCGVFSFVVGATPYLVVQVGDLLEVGAFWFLLTYVHQYFHLNNHTL